MTGSSNVLLQERNNRHHKPLLPPPRVYLQERCAKHQFIRHRNVSGIYERPERLRAASLGISAAFARLESAFSQRNPSYKGQVLQIIKSAASVGFDDLAVNYIHGADDGAYLRNLSLWAKESKDKIAKGTLEIPDSLKDLEDDLYLCPNSVEAFQAGLGTVCEAIDGVMATSDSEPSSRRAFVVIRPPGHHCGEDSPNGFCFVNGIAVGAAHAYIEYDLSRVVIFDIDLHHGNGTQEIVSQINSETHRDRLEKNGCRIFYGSIHDISSYPCEEGRDELIADASKSLSGEDGQWLENIHLQNYTSENQFWNHYETRYRKIFAKAEEFVTKTGGTSKDDLIILMSCGFDASEYESPAMNRHGRKVPTGFYHRFTRDVCKFAERYASGRVVSVMEGGYDDRAIISGSMAHVCGLADPGDDGFIDPQWWSLFNLQQLEAQTKKRKGRRPQTAHIEQWLQRALEVFPRMSGLPSTTVQVSVPLWRPSKPASAPVADASQPRKRGRPRKIVRPAAVSLSPSPLEAETSISTGTKRGHSRDEGYSNKLARPNTYVPVASTSNSVPRPGLAGADPVGSHIPTYPNGYIPNGYVSNVINGSSSANVLSFSHGNISANITLASGVHLRWQPPSIMQPAHLLHPSLPSANRKPESNTDRSDRNRYKFTAPMTLPTPSPSVDVEMKDEVAGSTRHLPPLTLVDLSRHWPKGLISPGALSAASGTAYKCHTHYEPGFGWGVRSIKNGMDQHCCYVPNHYKNGLRFLNYRVAQLAHAADAAFRLPRASASKPQKAGLRALRDIVQRVLLYHSAVRDAVFREVRERCYGGRNPMTAKPSGTTSVRLPTLDTWLLHEYVIGVTGRNKFDKAALEAAARDLDPVDLNWETWAKTDERWCRFGFEQPPAEKDAMMNKDAGIPAYPVVEGLPSKPVWVREAVENEVKRIHENPSAPVLFDILPWASEIFPSTTGRAVKNPYSIVS